MERHAGATKSYALALNTDADGDGDASTGEVSANIRTVSARQASPFCLPTRRVSCCAPRRRPASAAWPTPASWETDATGARRWDRNNDGDFDDKDEGSWRP